MTLADAYRNNVEVNGIGVLLVILLLLAGLLVLLFWVFMFLDVFKNKALGDTERLIWGIGMVVLPVLALLYFFVGRSKLKSK